MAYICISTQIHIFLQTFRSNSFFPLTDGIFETGANGVPSKSQNPTVQGQGGPSSTQCSNPSRAFCWRHPFAANGMPSYFKKMAGDYENGLIFMHLHRDILNYRIRAITNQGLYIFYPMAYFWY